MTKDLKAKYKAAAGSEYDANKKPAGSAPSASQVNPKDLRTVRESQCSVYVPL